MVLVGIGSENVDRRKGEGAADQLCELEKSGVQGIDVALKP